MPTDESLVETWRIMSRITLFVLDGVASEALSDKLETRGWSVGQHFAHLHTVRMMWMEGYKDLLAGLSKVLPEQYTDKAVLQAALEQSTEAVAKQIGIAVEAGKVKNFKRPVSAFVGYLIAHESYHHGEIGVILAQAGHRLNKEVAFGMWEWDKR